MIRLFYPLQASFLYCPHNMGRFMLGLKKRFGKNAVLKGSNYLEGATMRDRNGRIGGHKAE